MTKSHCIKHCVIFGGELMARSPTWTLSDQPFQTPLRSEHLGVTLDSRLTTAVHVDQSVERARAAFYGLVTAGMLA